jgi:D-3-phosphoglycerate dehydrogenase
MMVALTKRYRRQLFNSTVGFVGYGRVANQVENLLYGFNITSYTFDKPDNKKVLHELFRVCDIITVHIEENKATKGLIDANCFEKCTKQPIFINTSRASIVKPEALIKAYKNGKIRGFGLDVTEGYSQEEIGELMQKGFVTPHIAGKSLPSRELTDLYVLGELERRVLKEEELLSVN